MSARWALFLSGRGSTAQTVLDQCHETQVVVVVSSKAHAPGLARARRMGIPTLILSKNIDWNSLTNELKKRRVDALFLLGFMRLLPADFVAQWQGSLFNIHPSLLPKFPGAHAIEESFAAKAKMGVTIHEVIAEMDAGPRLLQQSIVTNTENGFTEEFADVVPKIARLEQHLIRRSLPKLESLARIAKFRRAQQRTAVQK